MMGPKSLPLVAHSGDNQPMGPRSVFVQDFVAVDRPYERVLAVVRGALSESALSMMARDAWSSQREVAATAPDSSPVRPTNVEHSAIYVNMASPRTRASTLIVPMEWDVGDERPLLDADLEFVRFGAERTHLSLTGRAGFLPPPLRGLVVDDRLLIAVVRHFLVELSVALSTAVDDGSACAPATHIGDGSQPPTAPEPSVAAMMEA